VAILQIYGNGGAIREGRNDESEQALRLPTSGTADHWGGLRRAAMTSLVLWLVITFAGVVLTNAA
jgi:hypothetical protein